MTEKKTDTNVRTKDGKIVKPIRAGNLNVKTIEKNTNN